jgi:hypothetical protein
MLTCFRYESSIVGSAGGQGSLKKGEEGKQKKKENKKGKRQKMAQLLTVFVNKVGLHQLDRQSRLSHASSSQDNLMI